MSSMLPSALHADWDEMVFIDRERRYGAYDLRKRYPRHLLVGVAGAVGIGLLFIIIPALSRPTATTITKTTVVNLDPLDLPLPKEEAAKEVMPPPPEPPKLKQLAFPIPEPTPQDELTPEDTATLHVMDSLRAAPNIGLGDVQGADQNALFDEIGQGEDEIPDVIRETGMPDPHIFQVTEEEPVPINIEDIRKLIGYPQIARDAGIEGTVVLRILVGRDGSYQRHLVINTAHPLLNQAVEEHITKLRFSPAIQGGRPIPFWVNVPFSFRFLR